MQPTSTPGEIRADAIRSAQTDIALAGVSTAGAVGTVVEGTAHDTAPVAQVNDAVAEFASDHHLALVQQLGHEAIKHSGTVASILAAAAILFAGLGVWKYRYISRFNLFG